MSNYYGNYMSRLIENLSKLPGIGVKTAQRLAFYIAVNMGNENAEELARSIIEAKDNLKYCSVCFNITDSELCPVCSDGSRDRNTIMVVESPQDMAAYEKTHEYKGLYHILHGVISPLNNISPDDLKIRQLLERINHNAAVKEIIIATNSNIEGEATALYLGRILKPLGLNVTRIAHGVPIGGDIEYIDDVTLSRALEYRHPI